MLEVQLDKPVMYRVGGHEEEGHFLTLFDPGGNKRASSGVSRMRFEVNKVIVSLADMQKGREQEAQQEVVDMDEDEALAEMIKLGFHMGEYEPFQNFIEAFKSTVVGTGVCKVANNADLLESHWDQLSNQEELAFKYAAFFGIGYLGDLKTKSEKPSE